MGSCEMSDELVGKLVDPPGKGDAGDDKDAAGNVDFLTGSM
jgi:hypothetical protein